MYRKIKPVSERPNLREPKSEFGKWFDEITIEWNLSLSDAEKMLGISRNALKEWRRGKSKLSRYHIAGIVRIFNMDLTDEELSELYTRLGVK